MHQPGRFLVGPKAGMQTLEQWARAYIESTSLAHKFAPPELPSPRESLPAALPEQAPENPGRPPELKVTWDKFKTPGRVAVADRKRRAHLLHTFMHHELQAAELMCWALLRFADAPDGFRKGLLQVCLDEIRHMGMYAEHVRTLGFEVGSFPVRDWFWQRAPAAETPAQFCALMGLGFEAGNLDHCARFEAMFEGVGDHAAAELTRLVNEEEVSHVAFAARWFEYFTGELTFERWVAELVPPLSPMVMRGKPLNLEARAKAGLSADFLEELSAWRPEKRGG